MGIQHKSQHVTVVFERQGDSSDHLVVVARDLASNEEAVKLAKKLCCEKPGTIYIPGRLYPSIMAQAKTVVRFLSPDECVNDGAGEPQQPDGARGEV
jgi:hypothetical protein